MKPRVSNSPKDAERTQRILDALKSKPSYGGPQILRTETLPNRPPRQVAALTQFIPRAVHPESRTQHEVFFRLKNWVSQDGDFYVGFGGAGDAILVIAACWNNPRALPIFFSNYGALANKLFDAFKIKALVHENIMGQRWTGQVMEHVFRHPNFKQAAHLTPSLNYDDWRINHDFYVKTMVTSAPWKSYLGAEPNPFPTSKVVVICPSGSLKDRNRQRFLQADEYHNLARFYLENGCTVLTVSHEDDLKYYKAIHHPHAAFVSADRFVDYRGRDSRHDIRKMLRYINSASLVVSTDTWIKTYSLICDIPTVVLMTRWGGERYKKVGEDITDYIFLHPAVWPKIKLAEVKPFITSQECLDSIPLVA